MSKHDREDWDGLAAEYVLGTLDAADRRRVEARLASDPRLGRLVDEWAERLAPLSGDVATVTPPPEVWRRIEAAIAPPAPSAAGAPGVAPAWWERGAVWRWYGLGATAVAAALALVIVTTVVPTAEPGRDTGYLAVLNEAPAAPVWLATFALADNRLAIRPLAAAAVGERSLELWLIEADAAPRSLGLIDPRQETVLALSGDVVAAVPRAAALAISLEPPGGSPTGAPTGPVMFQGTLVALAP